MISGIVNQYIFYIVILVIFPRLASRTYTFRPFNLSLKPLLHRRKLHYFNYCKKMSRCNDLIIQGAIGVTNRAAIFALVSRYLLHITEVAIDQDFLDRKN